MQLSRPTQRAASIARGRTMAASRCCRRVPPFVSNRNTLIGRVQRAALLPRFKTAIRASTAFTDEKQKSQNHSPTNFKNLKSPQKYSNLLHIGRHTHTKKEMLSCAPRIPIFLDSSELLLRGFLGNLTTPNVPPDIPSSQHFYIYGRGRRDARELLVSCHPHREKWPLRSDRQNQSPSFSIFIYRRLAETNLFFLQLQKEGIARRKSPLMAAAKKAPPHSDNFSF